MRFIADYFFKKIKINSFMVEKLRPTMVCDESIPVFIVKVRGWMELNFLDFLFRKYFNKKVGFADKYYYLSRVSQRKIDSCFVLGSPIIIFLKKGKNDRETTSIFTKLYEQSKKHNKKVLLFPTTVMWRKLSRRIKSNFKKIVFGDDRYPSWLQKFLFLMLACPDSVFEVDNGYELDEFVLGKEKYFDKKVKARVYKKIIKLEKGIVGPLLRQRERLIRLVLKDKKLNDTFESLATVSGVSTKEIMLKAKKMLFEISADYRESMVNRFRKILNWVWPKVIEGFWVNEEMVEKYREMSKEAPALILPCHRSHADYLIVSFLYYKYNLKIPYIAAGINLSFFPMGPIFRRSGAYFIRRTFKGEKLYPYVLEAYIKRLLIDGTAQEFFPEGTRSRTGKMLHPKTGLLSFNLNAIREGSVNDILIAPLSVVYGRLLESGAYLKEAEGQAKAKENATGVVKLIRLLGKKFGKVYVNMAEPFFLSNYFKENNIDIKKLDDGEFRQLIIDLGYRFIRDIQNATIITPISLVSLIILSDIKKGITVDSFNIRIKYALNYLGSSKHLPNEEQDVFIKDLRKAINYFLEGGKIKSIKIEGQEIYQVDNDMRNDLEYYKNNVVHYFLNASFLSLSILSFKKNSISRDALFEEYSFLKNIFQQEFVYDTDTVEREEFNQTLLKIQKMSIISFFGENVVFDSNGALVLKNIAGIVMSYIEAYYTVIESYYSISRDNQKLPPSIFPLILGRGKLLYEMGDIRRKESINKFYYQNAHQWLNKKGYLNWNKLFHDLGQKQKTEEMNIYTSLKEKFKNYLDVVFG